MSWRSTSIVSPLVEALRPIDGWQCEHVAAVLRWESEAVAPPAVQGVRQIDGGEGEQVTAARPRAGEGEHAYARDRGGWGPVGRPGTAVPILARARGDIVGLDDPAGPRGP